MYGFLKGNELEDIVPEAIKMLNTMLGETLTKVRSAQGMILAEGVTG